MRCRTISHLTLSLTRRFNTESRLNNSPQLSSESQLYIFNNVNYSPRNGKVLHAHMIKTSQNTPKLHHQLFKFYVINQELGSACKLFEEMPNRDVVYCNKLIHVISHIRRGVKFCIDLVFSCFKIMLEGDLEPDRITYTGLFRVCVDVGDVMGARMAHCRVFKVGNCGDRFIVDTLVDLYGKFGLVQDARSVFDSFSRRDLVCWNVMISSYVINFLCEEAVEVYRSMQRNGCDGDDFTITSLLKACGTLESCYLGRQIHGTICKWGLDEDVEVANAVVDMYAKVLCIVDARKAFDEMLFETTISWTTMIVAYGRCSDGKESIKLLRQMLYEDIVPDVLALASVVSSCGNMAMTLENDQVHAYSTKTGYLNFRSVGNALVSAYSNCGSIVLAFQCFNSILAPDLVSWTSMIGAYAYHGFPDKAVECFEKMLLNGIIPDRLAFLLVLAACTHGGNVAKGMHYFNLMVYFNLVLQSEHYTCLVDLLGRAGLLNEAFNILTSMPERPGPDALATFLDSCKVHENFELVKWATEKLLELEPAKAVNYTLMSKWSASNGGCSNAANFQEIFHQLVEKEYAARNMATFDFGQTRKHHPLVQGLRLCALGKVHQNR